MSDPVAHQSRHFLPTKNSETNNLSSIKTQEGRLFFFKDVLSRILLERVCRILMIQLCAVA